jgi:membrane-bound lytic murein transglycosylase B
MRARRRRRWPVMAAAVAALAGLVAPPPGPREALAGQVEDAASQQPLTGAARLSAGAPPWALTLTSNPAKVDAPEPATPAVITGLAANGIPNVVLNAYRVAAARMASAKPSCGIDWSLLAGIGRVESNHGRYGGAVLNPDGTATPRILGPALDGVKFAYIADTDGGQWDNDTRYDRAMGPMQFIPTTWRAYAVDADGNGTTDPFDIDDVALAAANYLCTAGGDLRTDAGQRRAVFAYNHSDSYVNQVLALARAYASGIPVADLPLVGNTTGAVPAPDWSGIPAAPGPAIGVRDRTSSALEQTTAYAPQSAGSDGASGQPSPGDAGAPGQPPATGSDSGPAPQGAPPPPPPGQAPPATAPGQPAPSASPPAPLPVPPPVPVPVPPPAPLPPPPATLPPPPALVPGVSCNVLGDPVLDILGLPVCPPA